MNDRHILISQLDIDVESKKKECELQEKYLEEDYRKVYNEREDALRRINVII